MGRNVWRWLTAWLIALILPWVVAMACMRSVAVKTTSADERAVDEEFAEEIGTDEKNSSVEVFAERRILMEQNGVHTYINLEDYLPGMILCQIEPEMEMEALKCQAVIARTYICRLMEGRSEVDEKELDLTYPGKFDRKILLDYQNRERAVAELERCESAVRATAGVVMKYEERYILPMFHKISAGRTRTGESDFPYLQGIESVYDGRAEGYLTEMEWNVEVFAEKIKEISGGQSNLSLETLSSQIQIVKKDDSGYVQQIQIGPKTYSGEEVQYALGLPSCCFSIFVSQGKVHARVQGVGHGYGLSQAGAQAMAKDGWGYEEILRYYYKNISLVSE
ncbi:MAG: SpoIID/LytB domain-containing protein [Brotaphodocola sp.]